MSGVLGFTLADLAGAVDSRKRYYANLISGLLSNPGETLAQLAAQDSEAARGNRYTQASASSVMPEVAQQGQQAMLDAALNVGGMLGITAFHGSPHKFDKFDMSKIGTGEGAQAYGHGLYFAENPGVARYYQPPEGNKPINWIEQQLKAVGAPADRQTSAAFGAAASALKNGAPTKRVLLDARGMAPSLKSIPDDDLLRAMGGYIEAGHFYKVDIPDEAVSKMLDWDKPLSQQPEAVRKALEPIVGNATGAPVALRGGSAWALGNNLAVVADKPSGKYILATQDGNKTFGSFASLDEATARAKQLYPEPTGATIYGLIGNGRASDQEAAQKLRALGIPGIRYLDAASRPGAMNWEIVQPSHSVTGEWIVKQIPNGKVAYRGPSEDAARAAFEKVKPPPGTSNFVLFDDELPKILGRE